MKYTPEQLEEMGFVQGSHNKELWSKYIDNDRVLKYRNEKGFLLWDDILEQNVTLPANTNIKLLIKALKGLNEKKV